MFFATQYRRALQRRPLKYIIKSFLANRLSPCMNWKRWKTSRFRNEKEKELKWWKKINILYKKKENHLNRFNYCAAPTTAWSHIIIIYRNVRVCINIINYRRLMYISQRSCNIVVEYCTDNNNNKPFNNVCKYTCIFRDFTPLHLIIYRRTLYCNT
jgi:hypothetical protein